jgi:hypothetical protein
LVGDVDVGYGGETRLSSSVRLCSLSPREACDAPLEIEVFKNRAWLKDVLLCLALKIEPEESATSSPVTREPHARSRLCPVTAVAPRTSAQP